MSHDDGRVVSNFIVSFGFLDHNLWRWNTNQSFCYVDDMIDGFVKMFEHQHALTGPINLGNPSSLQCLNWRTWYWTYVALILI